MRVPIVLAVVKPAYQSATVLITNSDSVPMTIDVRYAANAAGPAGISALAMALQNRQCSLL